MIVGPHPEKKEGRMKRDMDLVRKIFEAIEKSEKEDCSPADIHIDGFSEDQIRYHIKLLRQAGFIEVIRVGTQTDVVLSLTWNGHEFWDGQRRV